MTIIKITQKRQPTTLGKLSLDFYVKFCLEVCLFSLEEFVCLFLCFGFGCHFGEFDSLREIPLELGGKDADDENESDAEELTDNLHKLVVREEDGNEEIVERCAGKSGEGVNSLP